MSFVVSIGTEEKEGSVQSRLGRCLGLSRRKFYNLLNKGVGGDKVGPD